MGMTNDPPDTSPKTATTARGTPTASARLSDGRVVELVHDPNAETTGLVIWRGDRWTVERSVLLDSGRRLVPYSARNNLIRNDVVLLPRHPEEYGTETALVEEVQAYIRRYVDVSERFEKLASYYVLLTWVYDRFNELPYLRLRGDYGSGKTRFLLTVGALCNKPVFASGASTVSPLFHTLDAFRGTLILDESDFRFSDAKADIVKILNYGNVRGFPVLRTEVTPRREYNPRAFHVYGPKIVATRGYFDDRALESRFITEETGGRTLRKDVPISLPDTYREEARTLRNKLLMYRFRMYRRLAVPTDMTDPMIEPRLNQIFQPLRAVIGSGPLVEDMQRLARAYQQDLFADRNLEVEAQVLDTVASFVREGEGARISIKAIAERFARRHGADYGGHVSPKWIGTIVRRKLHVRTTKSHGVYVIPLSERPRLQRLFERYGIAASGRPGSGGDAGDVGDEEPAPGGGRVAST